MITNHFLQIQTEKSHNSLNSLHIFIHFFAQFPLKSSPIVLVFAWSIIHRCSWGTVDQDFGKKSEGSPLSNSAQVPWQFEESTTWSIIELQELLHSTSISSFNYYFGFLDLETHKFHDCIFTRLDFEIQNSWNHAMRLIDLIM